MKKPLLVFSSLLLSCGCAPKLYHYEHVVVRETPRLTAILRSTESNDAQGKPLSCAKVGLPIKSALSSVDYAVGIYTPLNFQPLVFLRAEDKAKNPLRLRGSGIRELDAKAGVRVVEGYTHVFDLGGGRVGQIEFEVVTEAGRVIGQEKIAYEIVLRGQKWEIDTL